jgi:hypothetical protein
MDVNGTAGTPITLESTSVVSPSISGDATRLYVVYRKSNENFIRTKFSGDGGLNWSYISTNPNNSNAVYIESVFSNNKLHVTYEVSNVIYYSYYNALNSTWSSQTTVSTGENGNFPRIAAWYTSSQDRVYFLYKKTSTESRWREWNAATSSWVNSSPQTAFTTTYNSYPIGFRVDDSRIYLYYSYYAPDLNGQWFNFINWVVRTKSNNSYINGGTPDINETNKIFTTSTPDGKSHTAFSYSWLLVEGSSYEIGIWRSNATDGNPNDIVYEFGDLSYYRIHLNLSSGGNDVHVIWQDVVPGHNQNNLRYKYDDQAPLVPTNFTGTTYNNHPKLTWSLINGPDVVYEIQRKISPFGEPAGTWQLLTTVNSATSSYVDNGFEITGQQREGTVEYKVRAKDLHPYYSGFTNVISWFYYGVNKINSGMVREYSLSDNYPNPFNPSTVINYAIKEAGLVKIKVYDILGNEVAVLVNETKEAGYHSVKFNASKLPTGVYIYTLQSGSFSDVKKMILVK